MGAPKQKWTPEEEAALRAGVSKHGPGKWRTILKDPEFSGVLCLRSNVDLKDKWRNMSVMANGLGSRERSRLALKRMPPVHRQGESPASTVSGTTQSDDDTLDPRALTTSSGSPQIGGSKRSIIRLDNLIMEAISNLKEPSGSHKTTIASYIEDEYWAPPNFKRLLSSKLKYLTATGKLVKIKRKFRIASASALSDKKRKSSVSSVPMLGLPLEGRQAFSPIIDRDDTAVITISDIDVELARIRNMTQQEAAAAAAQAVAEAEAAIADAEEAAREADVAEAEAEAAMAFAEAANKTLNGKGATRMMLRA